MNNKKKRTLFLILVFVLLIGISVGYAVITTALNVNGTVGLGRASFAIHFDNVGTLTHKATVNTEAYISDPVNKQAISFDVYLANIGDDYQFTTDIVNEGTIPGQVDSITLEGITESQARILDYELYYTGTTRKVKPGDYWLPGAVKNATFKIKYVIKDETLDTDLPQDDVTLNPTVVIRFKSGSIEDFRSRAAASKLSQNVRYMSSNALI